MDKTESMSLEDGFTFIPKPEDLSDRLLLETMYRFIAEMKHNADVATENIELDTFTLKKLLRMAERTVCRWRSNGMLRYHVRRDDTIYYKYKEIFTDVKSGRIHGRNFERTDTIRRLALYRDGILKGRDGLEWIKEFDAQVTEDYNYNCDEELR